MSLTNRWGQQNSLIRRVRQHGALTTLFRAADARPPAPPPLTVGVAVTPLPAPTPEPLTELRAPFPETSAEQPMAASLQPIETASAMQRPAPTTTDAVTPLLPPAAPPTVMRAPLSAPATPLPTTPTPLMVTTPAPLSPPAQVVGISSHEQVRSPSVSPLPHAGVVTGIPTAPSATVSPAPQPVSAAGNAPVAPSMPSAPPPTVAAAGAPPFQRTPAAEQPTTSGMDDATWARLRAIVRKHQAGAVAESASTAAPAASHLASAPATPTSSPSPGNPVQRQVVSPAPQPEVSLPASSPPLAPDALAPSASVDPETHIAELGETSTALPSSVAVARPIAPAVQTVQRQRVEPATSDLGLSPPIAPAGSALPQSTTVGGEADRTVAPPLTVDRQPLLVDSGTSDDATATGWSPPDTAQAPLQAVWPVQRLPDTGAEAAPPMTGELPAYVGPPPPEPPELRRQLSALPTAQPTESSIDLVLPRRPRPVRPGVAVPAAQGDAPPIQRQVAPSDASTPAGSPPPAATVATEIGPLPADLWQLIGEKPPHAAPSSPAVTAAPVQRTLDTNMTSMINQPPTPAMTAPQPPSAGAMTGAAPDLSSVVPEAAYVVPPLIPAPEPAQTIFAAERSHLPAGSDLGSPASMGQMAQQAATLVTNGLASTTAVPSHEADPVTGVQPPEKKTRSARQAHPPTKTSRRRRKRMTPV
jgi:hypothetical protein